MLQKFKKYIINNNLFNSHHKLLLAISGGADSVALAHLLKEDGFNFELAHCNFKLRGKESDADENFCLSLAKKLNVKIYTEQFDVKKYCIANKISIQMAARTLRYTWFLKLLKDKNFDYVLTAHHANDTIETVLINLLRGTGIKGLIGVKEKNGEIIRPLLNFNREEIDAYIKQNKLKFRLDKSNLDDKYERNFLRLNVIPKLKKLNPKIESTFIENSNIFKQEAEIVNDFLREKKSQLVNDKNDLIYINKLKLRAEKHFFSILYFIINPLGYNASQAEDIKINIIENGLVGKIFKSKTHQLTIDRNEIIIKKIASTGLATYAFNDIKIKTLAEFKKIKIFKVEVFTSTPTSTSLSTRLSVTSEVSKNELLIDTKQLIFPLTIRTKKTGDKFKPFGMKGFKLLSNFFKDAKLNVFEKENCKLLVNGNDEIIWVIGYRSDERYRAKLQSKTLLKISTIE